MAARAGSFPSAYAVPEPVNRCERSEPAPGFAKSSRGFTLVELLTVVVIVGVLAVVGLVALRKRSSDAKTGEILAMMQSIRGAQERFRAEHYTYLNVSLGDWYPADVTDGRSKRAFNVPSHADFNSWRLLNATILGPVAAGYRVNAGNPGADMQAVALPITPSPFPNPAPELWYIVQAKANTDNDDPPEFSHYIASSLNAEVLTVNDGE